MSATDTTALVDPSALAPLEEQCEWRSGELGEGYVFQLTDTHVHELDAALVYAEAHTDDVLDITRDLFPLPTLAAELAGLTRELINGRGVVLLRGVPVDRYSKDRASAIYWGVGTHLGRPWPQNAKGHLLGDVTDQNRAIDDPTARGNEIGGIAFPFHSDGSDLVGLFCLDAGAGGGASLVANAVTIHNDLVRTDPELAAELYAPFAYDFRGEQAPGAKPWYTMPIFTSFPRSPSVERGNAEQSNGRRRPADRLFVRYIRPYIESARRHDDAPRPSDAAREAMNRVDGMCADPAFHLSMMLEPGDMQFVNNYHVLHARHAYQDERDTGRIRHLKRLWLETEVLTDAEKPERFRLGHNDQWWSSKGRTKSELDV